MKVSGGKLNKKVGCNYTMHPHESKSVARLHIEHARRLIKPDGKYSDDIILNAQKLVEFCANRDSANGAYNWFIVTITSEPIDDGLRIKHEFKFIGNESVEITETV